MSPVELRVFINERMVAVAAGSTVKAAVECLDATLATALAEGRATLTDGRGLPLDAAGPVHAGDIIRVVVSGRSAATGADALS